MSKQRIILLVASVLGILSTFMPWATFFGISATGTQGDGWITLGIFVIPLIISVVGKRTQPLGKIKILAAITGAINTVIGIVEISNINSAGGGMLGSVTSIGIGVYLLIFAGICVCVSSFLKI